jgi:ATP-dependent RNA helicase DDX54/DBP10
MPLRAASPAASENEYDISSALFGADDAPGDGELNGETAVRFTKTDGVIDVLNDGFTTDGEDDEAFIAHKQSVANRQGVTSQGKKAKGGSFQSMGLDAKLLKAITRKGFSVPTPIQRKAIPLVLDGQDIVASARTGSGKTAAFVVPMIQHLKAHKTQVGARALILSPSRELALQTVKVTNELGKGTDLRTMLVVGGDSMEDQFKAMTSNPDIIIATPGRFLHLQIEMGLDLSSFKYVVFDEADRLFEMGFAAQLSEILHALPTTRQTLLFSATLPKSLVEFARAGLSEPKLVRLDAETKVSSDLENTFFYVKSAEKEAALLHILNDVIKMPTGPTEATKAAKAQQVSRNPKKRKRGATQVAEQVAEKATIIFTATKHHVEYITALLRVSGFAVSYLYSSLDQTARKINIQSFRSGQTSILVVTDIAARGVDIPILSNVINYDFASSAKLWVHRVGRTARAGRKGWSYNLVTTKDMPYMLDLQLFLSKRLVLGRSSALAGVSFAEDMVVGTLSREKLEGNIESANKLLDEDEDIAALRAVAGKGEKLYSKTRNSASSESVKRAKGILSSAGINELNLLFGDEDIIDHQSYLDRQGLLKRIHSFRPEETVFEIGRRGTGNETADTVRKARERMEPKRLKAAQAKQEKRDEEERKLEQTAATAASSSSLITADDIFLGSADAGDGEYSLLHRRRPGTGRIPHSNVSELGNREVTSDGAGVGAGDTTVVDMASASEDELEVTFSTTSGYSNNLRDGKRNGANASSGGEAWHDTEHFMSYTPRTTNLAEDRALSVHGGSGNAADFLMEARGATLDMGNDESKGFAEANRARGGMRWDKKSKKYVSRANDEDGSREGKAKYIKSESGQKIAASFRSGRFEAWKKRERIDRLPRVGEREAPSAAQNQPGRHWKHKRESAPKEADKYRDDYFKQKKRVAEAKEKRIGKFKEGAGKSELKGVEDIAKQRKLKELRRQKTGRPSRKGKK